MLLKLDDKALYFVNLTNVNNSLCVKNLTNVSNSVSFPKVVRELHKHLLMIIIWGTQKTEDTLLHIIKSKA